MAIYKIGQKIKVTQTIYGGAVYDRKGNITNANAPGVKYVDVGIIESITVEGSDTSFEDIHVNNISPIENAHRGAVKFRIIREKNHPMIIYPLHCSYGEQEIEILEDLNKRNDMKHCEFNVGERWYVTKKCLQPNPPIIEVQIDDVTEKTALVSFLKDGKDYYTERYEISQLPCMFRFIERIA